MKLVFVAGPYREKLNMDRSIKLCKELWAMGYAVISSHTNTPPDFVDVAPTKHFADGYLEIIKRCDYVVFLPEWETSSGCRAEMEFVKANKISYNIWPEEWM